MVDVFSVKMNFLLITLVILVLMNVVQVSMDIILQVYVSAVNIMGV